MIYDTLTRVGLYRGISPWLDVAIDAIEQTDLAQLQEGRADVRGEDVYYMVQAPALKPREETRWEAHRRYVDIQISLSGGEIIGYLPVEQVSGWQAYDEAKDILYANDNSPGILLAMEKNTFCILFPKDAHRPCERSGTLQRGRKVVVKVLAE